MKTLRESAQENGKRKNRRPCLLSDTSQYSVDKAPKKQGTVSPDSNQLNSLKNLFPKVNRKKRRQIFKDHPHIMRLFYCTSKYKLQKILFELPFHIKRLLRNYLSRSFIFHLHMRPINNISKLLLQRQVIYKAILNPEFLSGNKSFANNLVKNFCKGMVNFIVLFFDELVKEGYFPKKREKAPLYKMKTCSKTSLEMFAN